MPLMVQQVGSFVLPNTTIPHPDLIERVAMADAQVFAQQAKMPASQLLRYYYEFKGLQNLLRMNRDFVSIVPKLLLIRSKVAFASAKKSSGQGIPPEFREFIDHAVGICKTGPAEFNAFCLFFESLVGFYYGWGAQN